MNSSANPVTYSSTTLTVKLKSISIIGSISILIGTYVLICWVLKTPVLHTEVLNFVSMKFNTAILFILLGFSLLLTQFQIKNGRLISVFLYSFIFLISLTSLTQTIFQFNAGIDQLFVYDNITPNEHLSYPGRMSPVTSICFLLFCLSFAGFTFKSNFIHIISQFLLNVITATSSITLIGYLFGLSSLYNTNYIGSLATNSAFLFLFTSLAASWIKPTIGINKLFFGKKVGNIMATRLLNNVVYIILFFGILYRIGKYLEFYSFYGGVSMLIICFISAGFVMVWQMAKWMNSLDKGRRDAEKEVIFMNEKLELKVKQRSEKLSSLLAKYRETEAKFKGAFEHSAIGIALVTLKGKWFQVNRSLCDMMGYKEHELLTMSFENIYGDNRMTYSELEVNPLKIPSKTGIIERRYKCKDNSIVWISVNTAAVTNKKGSAIYFVSQFEDITKRKKAEMSLKKAYKEIENHVKLIQSVAWKQSHLMRRPLANLIGLTDILKEDHSGSEVLQHIEKELKQLDKIIIEMAEDSLGKGIKKIVAKKRFFKKELTGL
ncbi:hypothetical protein A5893_02905 [Pedobacter psychrophilus]|uniref:histidine kinase n=1 Tax=Pedobacter psychrophilus TaxID=1826909 RepID=A0A179DMW7_9SPHI|nr:PAS domain S-box protein [Pedobacter psychrophilus]OAQ42080.1 hypothetical protein A5893_02905 [Pedobacter psychrophilus]